MPSTTISSPDGTLVARDASWARTHLERARGLLGRPPLDRGEALIIESARQVHTFGMRYPIDVVFCDKRWVVRHVVRGMRPARITRLVFAARYTIEMPAGTLPPGVRAGDRLTVSIER